MLAILDGARAKGRVALIGHRRANGFVGADLATEWDRDATSNIALAVLANIKANMPPGDNDIPDLEPDEVAAPQLAVDGHVEEGEIAQVAAEFEADTDCPDVLRQQRPLLADDPAFAPCWALWAHRGRHAGDADQRGGERAGAIRTAAEDLTRRLMTDATPYRSRRTERFRNSGCCPRRFSNRLRQARRWRE